MPSDLRLDWATHKAAKYACEHWHYSGSVPVPPLVKIGIWENEVFIGVVIFSRGASSNLLKPYGLSSTEGCELTRVALKTHIAPVSRIVKIALKFLKNNSPGMRLVISFADPAQNHVGGIYQAGNWIYAGTSEKAFDYLYKGKKYHSRQVSEKGWNIQQGMRRKVPKPSECKKIQLPGKHRYLMPLDKAMRDQVSSLAKPYPKRTPVEAGRIPSAQGGANPTRSLQSSG